MTIYVVANIKAVSETDTVLDVELVPRLTYGEACDAMYTVEASRSRFLDIIKCDMPVADSVLLMLYEDAKNKT